MTHNSTWDEYTATEGDSYLKLIASGCAPEGHFTQSGDIVSELGEWSKFIQLNEVYNCYEARHQSPRLGADVFRILICRSQLFLACISVEIKGYAG